MGSITNALWIQNDPKGMTLEFSNTRPYWKSRLRAMGFSAVYSTEWKLIQRLPPRTLVPKSATAMRERMPMP